MATNPVVSLPDADRVRARSALRARGRLRLRAAHRHHAHAHVLLPALAWGEKDGTVTNSERRISRQRAFLPAPGEARADWRIVCDVARRMGFAGFDFPDAADMFREHAALSGFENQAEGFARAAAAHLVGRSETTRRAGRALLCGPRLLLLDEPLAAVDDSLKDRVLDYVEQVLLEWSIPTLYVTHDAGELARLARQVVRLEAGRIVPAS